MARREDFVSWDDRYKSGQYAKEPPHRLLVETAASLVPGRGLDLACGAGRHALFLAERGWQVTAVDSAPAALALLRDSAAARNLVVDARLADLERGEFVIEPAAYDLIVVIHYLQRDLFPAIRTGVRPGGLALAVIAMQDDDPAIRPMNPAFLLAPGELRACFPDWEPLHDREEKVAGKRRMAEWAGTKCGMMNDESKPIHHS